MFTTIAEVKELTDYDVSQETIIQAQAIIESYVGRLEIEVVNATDLLLLGRATAYQAAYMHSDPVRIFEQIAVSQIAQFGANITFKSGDVVSPWVAPLAVIACQRLSWKRIRSVKTGSIFSAAPVGTRWEED